MWIIGVLPISRGAPHRELSYFAAQHIAEGSIVRIKVRGKLTYGLAIRSTEASLEKQDVRKSDFALQKLASKETGTPLSRMFLRTAYEAAALYATGAGAVLDTLVPNVVLKRAPKLPAALEPQENGAHHEVLYLSAPLSDRVGEYRALARESLARGSSLLIIAPTIYEAERLAKDVGKGIEDRVILLHSGLSEKAFAVEWVRALNPSHSLLIVGTPSVLSLPRNDIGAIIVERETSRSYESDTRPFLSYKRVAELLAKNLGVRLILAATSPSVDTAWREMRHEVHEYGIPYRRLQGRTPLILDAKTRSKEKAFDPLLSQAYEMIDASLREKTPVLILSARRGVAPLTICDDCSAVLTCARCKSLLVLHREDASRFLCHFCGMEESASIRCRTCGGWRLTALGLGVDRIAETLEKTRPDLAIEVASPDRLKTKDAPKLAERFETQNIQVLIATEFIVPYLRDESCTVIVASVDSFMSIPEYRMNERIFTLLSELRTKAKEHFLVQTRQPDHPAIRACTEGFSTKIMREECAERERFHYPPATHIIRITVSGKQAAGEAEAIRAALAQKHTASVHEGRRLGDKRMHILVRIKEWPNAPLLAFLRALPQQVEVRVDPPTLSLD